MQEFFFYVFAAGTIVSSILTVGLRNPVYCTLSLLSAFLHIAGLFVLLSAEFIAAIQIIIYAGAVLVLYLFVIMLLNLKSAERVVHRQTGIAIFFGAVVLAEILLAFFLSPLPETGVQKPTGPLFPEGNTEALGTALFNQYLLPFEVVGVLLLGGIIGALVLAKQTPPR